MSRKQEARWVDQLRAGEPTAWAALVDHWSLRLYNYLLYSGVHEAAAQTLLPIIFSAVAEAVVGSLRIASLTVLIFTIARQHVLHFCQQEPCRPLEPPFPALFADEEATHFLTIFHHFTPEVQQMLVLHYLCDVSLAEISQILGQREEVLTKLLHRAQYYLFRAK
ncbi:MAG: hypothetical protein R3E79_55630 [Caldilineaceae bacterium]